MNKAQRYVAWLLNNCTPKGSTWWYDGIDYCMDDTKDSNALYNIFRKQDRIF